MYYQKMVEEMLEKIANELQENVKLKDKEKEDKVNEIIDKIISEDLLGNQAEEILNTLEPKAPIMYEENRLLTQEFESRLQNTWLEAFYIIQLSITITTESSIEFMDEIFDNGNKKNNLNYISILKSEMIELQAQAIVLAKEMNLLLKSGYSDAAFSRWRSLFEVTVIMGCLSKIFQTNQESAEKVAFEFYLSSVIAERKKAKKTGDKEWLTSLNEKIDSFNISNKDIQRLGRDYGWADSFIPNKTNKSKRRIYFNNLIEFSEKNRLHEDYKDACQYIHVSPYGLHHSLGEMYTGESKSNIVFGPSNIGLSKPLQLLLISLLDATRSFFSFDLNIDRVIQLRILDSIVDKSLEEINDIEITIRDGELE